MLTHTVRKREKEKKERKRERDNCQSSRIKTKQKIERIQILPRNCRRLDTQAAFSRKNKQTFFPKKLFQFFSSKKILIRISVPKFQS